MAAPRLPEIEKVEKVEKPFNREKAEAELEALLQLEACIRKVNECAVLLDALEADIKDLLMTTPNLASIRVGSMVVALVLGVLWGIALIIEFAKQSWGMSLTRSLLGMIEGMVLYVAYRHCLESQADWSMGYLSLTERITQLPVKKTQDDLNDTRSSLKDLKAKMLELKDFGRKDFKSDLFNLMGELDLALNWLKAHGDTPNMLRHGIELADQPVVHVARIMRRIKWNKKNQLPLQLRFQFNAQVVAKLKKQGEIPNPEEEQAAAASQDAPHSPRI